MLKGIGTDILQIARLRPIFDRPDYLNDSFVRKTYTSEEIRLAQQRPVPLYFYATRFAGKEAVFKALSLTGEDLRLQEIEILSNEAGKPYVLLHGTAASIAEKREISQILLSLSYETDYAIAYAAVE